MKPFELNEWDWVIDPESGMTALLSPWLGQWGVWFDVPEPIFTEKWLKVTPPPPDWIVPTNTDRRRTVIDCLIQKLQEKTNAAIP